MKNALKRLLAAVAAMALLAAAAVCVPSMMYFLGGGIIKEFSGYDNAGMSMILYAFGIGLGAWLAFRGAEAAWAVAWPSESKEPSGKAGRRVNFAMVLLAAGIFSLPLAIFNNKVREIESKRGEGALKGNVGALRSALSIYYGDMSGQYPEDLAALTIAGKYIQHLPSLWSASDAGAWAAPHQPNREVQRYARFESRDTGKWGYVTPSPGNADSVTLFIDCTHTDTKGSVWTYY